MQHVHLGRSGLRISRLCLGCMNFGPETSEADRLALAKTSRATASWVVQISLGSCSTQPPWGKIWRNSF